MMATNRLCKECGTVVSASNESCPKCGAHFPDQRAAPPDGRNWLKIGCLGLIGLFALLVIIGMVSEPDSDTGPSMETTEDLSSDEPVEQENDPGISAAEFSRLQTGMSYAEAVTIIGSPGELMSENAIAGARTVMYMWDGESGFGANANAMFQNDKLIQKAQFGLE